MFNLILGKKTETREDATSMTSSSTISTKAVEDIIDRLKLQGVRNSTRKNYYVVWRLFNQFYIKLDRKPQTWEERIILFVGYLVETKKCSQTVKSYISAIKKVLLEDGITVDNNDMLLCSLTKACKIKNDKVRTRFPIQKGVLNLILKQLGKVYGEKGQEYLEKLYKALFTTAYYGLFRVGELTCSEHAVKARDVHIAMNKQKLLFILRSSKTHGSYMKPQRIKISSQPTKSETPVFCPYQALRDYIELRPGYRHDNEQFFIFRDSNAVKPENMRSVLHKMLLKCGLQPSSYNTHSFRSGRCVDLRRLGLEVSCIMKLGRWTSSAVFDYLSDL